MRKLVIPFLLFLLWPYTVYAHAIRGAEYYYHSSSAYHTKTIPMDGHSYHIDDAYYLEQFTSEANMQGLVITASQRCRGDGYGSTASDVTVARAAGGGGGGGGGGDRQQRPNLPKKHILAIF